MLGLDALPRDVMVDTALGSDTGGEPRRANLGRAAALITACNLVSRISGFVRVVAVAGALGIAFLGDAYQRSNEVSNVLFELLIGGLLFSVLVPSFVELLSGAEADAAGHLDGAEDPHAEARRLGSVLATRGVVVIGALALVGMFASGWIMRVLTLGTPAATRADQIELGSFLLWFIMPQLVFYAAGSVASALLQADHRFFATSIAPLFNNIVVTVTMVAFAASHDPARGFALTTGEKVLLGGGTLAGTVAMTIVPFLALWRAGLGLRPRWSTSGMSLQALVRRGAWAAGHVGLNEVLIGVTIVLSGRVDGGVIAYQTAYTFFLLPHALLAYPIFTALFPRLSRKAARDDHRGFAADLQMGVRSILLLLVPASGLLAVVAAPALSVIRLGELDAHGVRLVALVLVGYLVGLTAYSVFFLLTRASYALGDARRPTLVNLGVTVASVVGMFVAVTLEHGTALLVTFGVVQAVAITVGSIVLFSGVRRQVGMPIRVGGTGVRTLAGGAVAVAAAFGSAAMVGWDSRPDAVVAVVAAAAAGVVVDVAILWVLRTPEIASAWALLARRGRRRA
jgi:putative peptidoglycan lipid II flippase